MQNMEMEWDPPPSELNNDKKIWIGEKSKKILWEGIRKTLQSTEKTKICKDISEQSIENVPERILKSQLCRLVPK